MKYFKLIAKIFVSALALCFVFSKIDLQSIWELVKKASIVFIFLGILFFIASQILSAYRLNCYFKVINVHISNATNIKLYALGMFYNLLLPGELEGMDTR